MHVQESNLFNISANRLVVEDDNRYFICYMIKVIRRRGITLLFLNIIDSCIVGTYDVIL